MNRSNDPAKKFEDTLQRIELRAFRLEANAIILRKMIKEMLLDVRGDKKEYGDFLEEEEETD